MNRLLLALCFLAAASACSRQSGKTSGDEPAPKLEEREETEGAGEEARDEKPAAPQGFWSRSGTLKGEDGQRDFRWTMEVKIDGDSFVRTGYPPWDESARIVRVERDEDDPSVYRLHVEDWVRNGEERGDGVIEVKLSEDGSLELDGKTLRPSSR